MKSRKGFTLIELMVVVLIVAVLAAIIVPLLLSRIERARASEGKAIAGQIATAVRTYAVDPPSGTISGAPVLTTDLGFKSAELNAKYYQQGGSGVSGLTIDTATGLMSYVVLVKSRDIAKDPDVTLTCIDNVTTITPP
jgi:type IV pilus assembly protein PilA